MTFVHGMKRPPGAGMRRGFKYPQTRDREAQLAAFRQQVMGRLEPMTTAQLAAAEGVPIFMLRRRDGSYTRATDLSQVDAALAAGDTAFQIWVVPPSTHAFTALMDRTFGKPTERIEVAGPDGQPIVVVKPW